MNLQVKAWLGLFGTVILSGTWFGACGSNSEVDDLNNGNAFCGNGAVEAGEECDDGNLDNADSCSNTCSKPSCGDGVVQGDEECDDGNEDDTDGCSNSCVGDGSSGSSMNTASTASGGGDNCGNGEKDDGEFCDDGNMVNNDECPNDCSEPYCGDGITQAHLGEDCDDGIMSENDVCPDDCMDGSSGSGGGDEPIDCDKQLIFHSVVTNSNDPTQPGSGVNAVWSYGGQIGTQAGDDMCAARGAHHACTYREIKKALDKGELDSAANQTKLGVDNGTKEFHLHRVYETVGIAANGDIDPNGTMSAPGPGGRCNDWTYPTGHIADGEYVDLSKDNNGKTQARYYLDQDTKYTGVGSDNHQGSGTMDGGPCAGGNATHGILCCYKECIQP